MTEGEVEESDQQQAFESYWLDEAFQIESNWTRHFGTHI